MSGNDDFDIPDKRPSRSPLTKDGRFYTLIDPVSGKPCKTRVTTWAKTIESTYLIELWSQRMAIYGLALRSADLLPLVLSLSLEHHKEDLNKIVKQCQEAAKSSSGSNKGTALHNFTDSVDRGEVALTPNAEWAADVAAYQKALATHGYTILPGMVERYVVVPQISCSGKFDRLVMCPDGMIRVLDLKTAAQIDFGWGGIAIQLACYAHATHIWVPEDDTYIEMPGPIDQDEAIVVHLPVGTAKCTIYSVDIAAGWEASQLCSKVRTWRYRKDLARVLVPADDYAARIERAQSVDELHKIFFDASTEDKWTQELLALTQSKKRQLAKLGVAV